MVQFPPYPASSMDIVTQGGVVTSSDYGGWVVDSGVQSSSEATGPGSAVTAGTLLALRGAPPAEATRVVTEVAKDGRKVVLSLVDDAVAGTIDGAPAGVAKLVEALGFTRFFNAVGNLAKGAFGNVFGGAVGVIADVLVNAKGGPDGTLDSPQVVKLTQAYMERMAAENPERLVLRKTEFIPGKPLYQLRDRQTNALYLEAGGELGVRRHGDVPEPQRQAIPADRVVMAPVGPGSSSPPKPVLPSTVNPMDPFGTGTPNIPGPVVLPGASSLIGQTFGFGGSGTKPGVATISQVSQNPPSTQNEQPDPAAPVFPPVTLPPDPLAPLAKAHGTLLDRFMALKLDYDPQVAFEQGKRFTPEQAKALGEAVKAYESAYAADPLRANTAPALELAPAKAALKGFESTKGAQTGGVYDPFLPGAVEEFLTRYPEVPLERWIRETSGPLGGGEAELERRLRDWAGNDPDKQMAVEGLLAKRKQPVGPTNGTPSSTGGSGGTTGNGGTNAAGGAGDDLSRNDLDVLRQAIKDTVEAAAANPVTPSGYNESTLIDSLLSEAAAGRETAVLLGDSNNFSTYNQLLGNEGGDAAIEATTQAYNRAAARLNEMYADQGIRFFAGRKAGDEMFMVAVIDPSHPNAPKQMPKTVPQDMVRVTNDEIQATNAARIIPIPTGTSSAAIIPPARAGSADGLKATLDEVDHAGTAYFNQGGGPWQKNGGGVYDLDTKTFTPLPGPTYQPREGQQLPNFAAAQGRIKRPGEGPEPNATIMTEDGSVLARPEMIPDPNADTGDQPRVPLPDSVVDALIQQAVGEGVDIIDQLNELRETASLEAVFRKLAAEGIDIKNQPVGLAILDGMIDVARAQNGQVTLEAFEPRGLKKLNDEGRVVMPDGSLEPSSHGGGDKMIELMVRANQQAIDDVLKDRASEVVTFRDRGKRFMNAYPSTVTPAEIEKIEGRRAELFGASPLAHTGADGVKRPIVLANPDGTTRPFALGLGYATVTSNPATRTEETAQTMRDWLVAPLPGPNPSGKSALGLGNDAADRLDGSQVPFDLIPNAVPGLRIWTTPLDPFPGLNQRRQPPAP